MLEIHGQAFDLIVFAICYIAKLLLNWFFHWAQLEIEMT